MCMTSSERQQRRYRKAREQGITLLTVPVDADALAVLKKLHVIAAPGDTWRDFLSNCLLKGAKFSANSGGVLPAGHKARSQRRDIITNAD